MICAGLVVEFILLNLWAAANWFFLTVQCESPCSAKGQIWCCSMLKFMPLEKQTQHSEDVVNVSEYTIVCVGERLSNVL